MIKKNLITVCLLCGFVLLALDVVAETKQTATASSVLIGNWSLDKERMRTRPPFDDEIGKFKLQFLTFRTNDITFTPDKMILKLQEKEQVLQYKILDQNGNKVKVENSTGSRMDITIVDNDVIDITFENPVVNDGPLFFKRMQNEIKDDKKDSKESIKMEMGDQPVSPVPAK